MRKLVSLCAMLALASVASADPSPVTVIGRPRSVTVSTGTHPVAYRVGRDRYAVLGEGVLRTRGCTVTAPGLEARISRTPSGRRWVTFVDPERGYEGECEVDDGPVVPAPTVPRAIIVRPIATTGGGR